MSSVVLDTVFARFSSFLSPSSKVFGLGVDLSVRDVGVFLILQYPIFAGVYAVLKWLLPLDMALGRLEIGILGYHCDSHLWI